MKLKDYKEGWLENWEDIKKHNPLTLLSHKEVIKMKETPQQEEEYVELPMDQGNDPLALSFDVSEVFDFEALGF